MKGKVVYSVRAYTSTIFKNSLSLRLIPGERFYVTEKTIFKVLSNTKNLNSKKKTLTKVYLGKKTLTKVLMTLKNLNRTFKNNSALGTNLVSLLIVF